MSGTSSRVVLERQRHVDLVGAARCSTASRASSSVPSTGSPACPLDASLVVEEADDAVAELAVGEDRLGHRAAELAGARHEHARQVLAGGPVPLLPGAQRRAAEVQQQRRRARRRGAKTAWLYSQRGATSGW